MKLHSTFVRSLLLFAVLSGAAATSIAAPTVQPYDKRYENIEGELTPARSTEDQRIRNEVIAVLSRDSRLSGTIGVETRDRLVTLVGVVGTLEEIDTADRDAQEVDGVRDVNYDDLRAQVGQDY